MNYPINEIFKTIQAEGSYSGIPSLFVRLQGCDVGCAWCDTKHTWPINKDSETKVITITKKIEESESYGMFSVNDIIEQLDGLKHIVITGGEPCMYDLTELTSKLISLGNTVQIETSGTQEVKAHPETWVTVSPKIGMKGGFKVLDSVINRANEIKMPVGKQKDIDNLIDLNIKDKLIYLQPLSLSNKATKICIDYAMKYNYRISIQWHKYIDIR